MGNHYLQSEFALGFYTLAIERTLLGLRKPSMFQVDKDILRILPKKTKRSRWSHSSHHTCGFPGNRNYLSSLEVNIYRSPSNSLEHFEKARQHKIKINWRLILIDLPKEQPHTERKLPPTGIKRSSSSSIAKGLGLRSRTRKTVLLLSFQSSFR